ncbi:hypothetical protein [Tengunoibacter tsumagoiensis]|uniref:WxL domain-containing protein n=1 Tax=Tengunoibacter tsumagoiensis TaxID=2014871 RepID=A0A402A7V3_9CHLR|nr:hypothetical protein [Tengunoibacter tsumagoiensis]GCE15223.1 hypothetical protein KTT_50820 [Tengunoibacter tsumagoiensis]
MNMGYGHRQMMRLGVILLFMSSVTCSLLFGFNATALAAACNPATPLDASAGSASCDMTINAQVNPGVLTLTNDAAAAVPGSPFTLTGANLPGTFTFTSVVKDHRGLALGWTLSAASSGLKNGTTTLPLNLTGLDVSSSCTNGTCTSTTFTAVTPLTTTSTKFLTAGNSAHTIVVDGDYTNKIDGTFTIVAGSPSGLYSGIITITLANTF